MEPIPHPQDEGSAPFNEDEAEPGRPQSSQSDLGRATSASLRPTFGNSKITIAVDVSGSTYNEVLDEEKRTIRNICALVSPDARSNVDILPWSSHAEGRKGLDQLDSLQSDGGTNPNVLLDDRSYRASLQDASFWFLMTDGKIDEGLIRRCTKQLLQHSLHSKACIISIFGRADSKPSKCNVTVGLAIFAVSPHVAFLYTNVDTGTTTVLQTKGCFVNMLPRGRPNPVLDYNTTWADLPRVSYENLSRVSIPPPQSIGGHELLLNNDLRLNLEDFFQDVPSDDRMIKELLDNEDNLKSLVLTAKFTGQKERLQAWLNKAEKQHMEDLQAERQISERRHSQLMEDVALKLADPNSLECRKAQERLQEANTGACLLGDATAVSSRRRSSITYARRLSTSAVTYAEDNIGAISGSVDYQAPKHHQSKSIQPFQTPGFVLPSSPRKFYRGECGLCAVEARVMALLLRKTPSKDQTPNFPKPDSHSRLIYPLAMGNYPETDIVSSLVVCDPCSYRLVSLGKDPWGESIVSAIPLVSFNSNRESWLETMNMATNKRFHRSDLPSVFLAVLYTKMERLLNVPKTPQADGANHAIKWTCNMLLSEVMLHRTQIPELDHLGIGALHEVLLRNFRNALTDSPETTIMDYPIDGFIVANVALSNSRHNNKITGSKRKRVVLLRFLYHLTQKYHEYMKENEPLIVQAAKGLLLLLDDPVGPRSLLQWEFIRGLSGHWKSKEDLLQHLSRMRGKLQAVKLSISVKDLLESPLLSRDDASAFQRLGILFNWIASQGSSAIAAFLHHLLRKDHNHLSPKDHFLALCSEPTLQDALAEPEGLSSKQVEEIANHLPSLEPAD